MGKIKARLSVGRSKRVEVYKRASPRYRARIMIRSIKPISTKTTRASGAVLVALIG
jgi:hypothetical protein